MSYQRALSITKMSDLTGKKIVQFSCQEEEEEKKNKQLNKYKKINFFLKNYYYNP